MREYLSSVQKLLACPSAWTIRVSFFYVPENYPNTIREKKQSPWTIQILSQKFWQNVVKKTNTWNYPRKKTNTLNYPNTIRYFRDLAKFSRIFHENKIFYNMCFFVKIWQCLTLCSSQSKRQIIAKCKIRWLCSDIILCSWKKYKHLELSD